MRLPSLRPVALLVAMGLAASACGGGSADQVNTESGSTDQTAAATESNSAGAGANEGAGAREGSGGSEAATDASTANFPSADVIDLGSGSTVNFAEEIAGGSLPTLIWFWAPH